MMELLNRDKLVELINESKSVYSFENTLFIKTKKKIWIARGVTDKYIQFAVNCYHDKLSRDLKKLLDESDECERVIKKYYKHWSVQRMANMLGISHYKVCIIIDKLISNGQISRTKKKKTKWGAFIKENYKTMDKKMLMEVTGMTRTGIAKAVARIKAEEEQNELR